MIKNLNSSWWKEKLLEIEAFVRNRLTGVKQINAGTGIYFTDVTETSAVINATAGGGWMPIAGSGIVISTTAPDQREFSVNSGKGLEFDSDLALCVKRGDGSLWFKNNGLAVSMHPEYGLFNASASGIGIRLASKQGLMVDSNGLAAKVDGTTIKINDNGELYSEGGGTAAVSDVKVNGTSIVTDHIANIPNATLNQYGVVRVDDETIKINTGGDIHVPLATTSSIGVVKVDGTSVKVNSAGTIYVDAATGTSKGIVQPDNTTINVNNGIISVRTATSANAGIVKPYSDDFVMVNNELRLKHKQVHVHWVGVPYDKAPYFKDNYNNTIQYPCCTYEVNYNSIPTSGTCYGAEGLSFTITHNPSFNTFTVTAVELKTITVNWGTPPESNETYVLTDNNGNTCTYPATTYTCLVEPTTASVESENYTAPTTYSNLTFTVGTYAPKTGDPYITIVAADNAAATYTCRNTAKVVEYSTDKVTWNVCAHDEFDVVTTLCNAGETCYLRSNDELPIVTVGHLNSVLSNIKSASGNVNTLINYSNPSKYETGTPLPSDVTLCSLFRGCTSLVNISGLTLPATNLSGGFSCYYLMFYGCTSLTSAPALPATTLGTNCYYAMFQGCTSLTTAPALPVTTLATGCYSNMFYGCRSLTTAPALPATTLAERCYQYMFEACTSLTTAPALPATTLAEKCYQSMFFACRSLTTAPALPATTVYDNCYYAMFQRCYSLTTAPALPATTLATSCYYAMFEECSSLTSAPALPATTLATSCYYLMFYGCTSLTSAPALPATTLATGCYTNMFYGCTSLTTAPALPATTLAEKCYQFMFEGCTSLTSANVYATTDTNGARDYMFKGCSATGSILHVAPGLTWDSSTSNGSVGSNWTIIQDL